MSSDNLCVSNSLNVVKFCAKPKQHKSKKAIWKPTGKVFTQIGYIWRPTGRTFTIVGNACPLTRITTTNEVPSRKPIVLDSESPKPVVKLVYSRKPRKNKNTESVSKTKVVQIVLWYLDSGCSKHMTGDRSQLTNFISKFLGSHQKSLLTIPEAVHLNHAISTGSPSSTTVDQDAPSPSNSHTTQETQTPIISHDVEEDNHDIEVAHMGNDPYFANQELQRSINSSMVGLKLMQEDFMNMERLGLGLCSPPNKHLSSL
ncbi:hypothetical protein Tco_0790834 [Tanacetum coccineum]